MVIATCVFVNEFSIYIKMIKENVLPRLTGECELGSWTGRGEDDICEKLKTLKDIEGIDPHFEEDTGDYVFNGDIKAEAVKWVSAENLKKLREEFRHHTGPWKTGVHEFEDFYQWSEIEFANFVMSKFINITEKDYLEKKE